MSCNWGILEFGSCTSKYQYWNLSSSTASISSCCQIQPSWASLVSQRGKNLPIMRETWVLSLGQEDPLEEGTATHSSIPAWRVPEQRSLAGYSVRVWSVWLQNVGHDWSDLAAAAGLQPTRLLRLCVSSICPISFCSFFCLPLDWVFLIIIILLISFVDISYNSL